MVKIKQLEGVYHSIDLGLYKNSCDDVLKVSAVSRDYAGRKKRPEYYISQKEGKGFKYVSGLFKTKKPDEYSMDTQDKYGIKIYYLVSMTRDSLTIKKAP